MATPKQVATLQVIDESQRPDGWTNFYPVWVSEAVVRNCVRKGLLEKQIDPPFAAYRLTDAGRVLISVHTAKEGK